jgi:hypothetical protein
MLRNILFPCALILFWSCGPEAGGKSMTLTSNNKNNYSEGNFQEGFWVEDFSLQVIEQGDLNFNVGWSYLRTIVKNGEPKLIIKNPIEEIHYDLRYVDSCFSIVDTNDSTHVNEQIHFKDSGKIVFGALAETVPYTSIDSGRVIYDYFFVGNFVSVNLKYEMSIQLKSNGDLDGWHGVSSYESHAQYEKPVFLVKRNDSIVNTYYIQDHTTGFELYEINNKQTFTQPGMALDIGTLRYRFIKQ